MAEPIILSEEDVLQRLPERAKRELILGYHAKREFARHAQARVAKVLTQMPRRHVEGLGQRFTFDADQVAVLRAKHGLDCLHDPAFIPWLLKHDARFRTGSVNQKLTVRVDGLRDSRRPETPESRREPGAQPASEYVPAGPGRNPATPAAGPAARSGGSKQSAGHDIGNRGGSLVFP